jgi:hypothetical protein
MQFPKSPFYIIGKLILNYFFFIIQYIKSFNNKPQAKPIDTPHVETQYEKTCKKYAEFYGKESADENSNIDPVLYDFLKRKETFVSPDNELEKQWKSRILIENTPRGNVMIYFNPYLLSYQYYSDEQIIPYKILEQVATKYVVMFRCKDFFIDPGKRPSNKILEVLQKEEDSLKSKKMKVNDITKCVNIQSESKDVFASLKNYRSEAKPTEAKPTEAKPTEAKPTEAKPTDKAKLTKEPKAKNKTEEPKFSNKFVRIGKMCEFNITQKPANKKIEAVNELMFGAKPVNKVIDFFDDLEIVEMPEDEEPKSSYKMFKQMSKLKTA